MSESVLEKRPHLISNMMAADRCDLCDIVYCYGVHFEKAKRR